MAIVFCHIGNALSGECFVTYITTWKC